MQATVRSFDPVTRSGSVFLDDGTVLTFGAGAFAASGLRLLRRGQRVALACDPDGTVASLALATFPLASFPADSAPGRSHKRPADGGGRLSGWRPVPAAGYPATGSQEGRACS